MGERKSPRMSNSQAPAEGCPVRHTSTPQMNSTEAPPEGCPVRHTSSSEGCPVQKSAAGGSGNSAEWLLRQKEQVQRVNQMPPANQMRAPGQGDLLSKQRIPSTIPKGSINPESQNPEDDNWSYPSEQMFYNAMKRKGHEPREADMKAVVAIHNTVNERCWQQILVWEGKRLNASQQDAPTPQLVKFEGRPNDLSPKARMLGFIGYSRPFDRHDWLVDRNGTEVRYVIDFYEGAPQPGKMTSMYLDVRPALDSFSAAFDRVSRFIWS